MAGTRSSAGLGSRGEGAFEQRRSPSVSLSVNDPPGDDPGGHVGASVIGAGAMPEHIARGIPCVAARSGIGRLGLPPHWCPASRVSVVPPGGDPLTRTLSASSVAKCSITPRTATSVPVEGAAAGYVEGGLRNREGDRRRSALVSNSTRVASPATTLSSAPGAPRPAAFGQKRSTVAPPATED